MDIVSLNNILSRIKNVRAGIIGDFCVDIYWHADMTKSELSKETPIFPLPVIKEAYSPGAAGNAAANMAALTPACLNCIGLKGADWRGDLLERSLRESGISATLLTDRTRVTNAYCKPLKKGISDIIYEDPRIDFDNFTAPQKDIEETVIAKLENLSSSLDVLAVSDQFKFGIITKSVREKLCELSENGLKVIVDSRYNIASFRNMFLKPNEYECAAAVGKTEVTSYEENAKRLASQNNATVIETLGEKGAVITDGSYLKHIPAVKTECAIDICGAGDTSLAALALSIGAGFNLMLCAEFAALASAVTIRKTGQTGTASAAEIIDLFNKESENFFLN